ncbi:MAG: hypothetical protein E7314_01330 [Clostridiales bacterium]|nr:hypothetical protein [Clostridiales bacterium]
METREILEKLNENSKEFVIKNRRKGPDFLLQFINFVGLIIWFFLIMLFSVCDKAGVEFFNFSQNIESVEKIKWLNFGLVMSSIMFFVSAVLLLISFRRTRRKTDKIKISLLVSEMISFFIGIILLIKLY